MADENFRAECGDCIFCSDNGTDPNDVSQHLYTCNVNPPLAVPVGGPGGSIAIMTVRPNVKKTDLACKEMKSRSVS